MIRFARALWRRWRGLGRADSTYEDYLAGDGRALPLRLHVSLDLTYRCNLRCGICFLHGAHLDGAAPSPETARPEFGLSDWIRTIEDLHGLGVRSLVMTGGEVFLLPWFLDLLARAKALGFGVSVLTNGSLIDDARADRLVEIAPDFVRFSLDGDRETHDAICREACFDRLMAALDRVAEAKRRHGAKRPGLGFETVVQRRNQDVLPRIVEIAAARGVRDLLFSNVFFVPPGARIDGQETRAVLPEYCRVDPDAVARGLDEARRLAEAYGLRFTCRMRTREDVERVYLDPSFSFLGRCLYPWLMARIDPWGDVIPCTGSRLVMGSLRERPFAEIWNGEAYVRFRRRLAAEGLLPACAKCNTLSDERWRAWDELPRPRP